MSDKPAQIYHQAQTIYSRRPDWVTFYREVLGLGGIVRQMCSRPEDLMEFEQTDQYTEIQLMLAKLRAQGDGQPSDKEPTRVITVRLPQSLHESLKTEAHERRTSMNQLCISKLLQMVENELVPVEAKSSAPARDPEMKVEEAAAY